jgi:hypothetical protein
MQEIVILPLRVHIAWYVFFVYFICFPIAQAAAGDRAVIPEAKVC